MLLAILSMIAPAVFLVSCFNQPPIQEGLIIIAELLLIYGLLVGALFLFKPKTVGKRTAKLNGRTIVSFVLVAALMGGYGYSIFSFQNELFTKSIPGSVTFINTGKVPNGMASEIWLRCYQNGRQLSSEKLLESANQENWFEKDGFLVSTGEGDSMTITFDSLNNISFDFQRHPYCGSVKINYPGIEYQIELYSETGSIYSLNPKNNIPIEYHAGALSLLGILLTLTGIALYWFMISYEGYGWRLYYLLCFIPTVAIAWEENELTVTYSVILFGSLIIVLLWTQIWKTEYIRKYLRGFILFMVFLVSLYTAFALVGANLILKGQRMDLSLNTLFYFCLSVAIAFPLCSMGVLGIDALKNVINHRMVSHTSSTKILRWGMFALMSCLLILISLQYYPCFMSPDGVSHWLQATGEGPIYDAHPVLFILFVRLLAMTYESPYVFAIAQIILFSYIISGFLQILYEHGLPVSAVVLLGIASAILPSNYMTLMLLSKNPLSGLLNLWLMQLLIHFAINPQICVKKWSWITAIVLVGCCAISVRKNNIVILPILAVCFVFITVRHYKAMKGRLIMSILLIITLNTGLNVLINKTVPVIHTSDKIIALLTPYEAMASMDVVIPENILSELEDYVCVEDLGNHYNRFNSDVFSWSDVRFNTERLSDMHLVSLYLEALAAYPDIVVKDRLDSIESYWSIFPSKADGAYNVPFVIGIHSLLPKEMLPTSMENIPPDRNDCYVNPRSMQAFTTSFANWTFENEITNIIIWRSGLSLVLLLLCLIYLVANKQWIFFCVSLPTLAIMGTVFLAVGWQIFAYQYFFPIAVRWFIICMLFLLPARTQPLPETNGSVSKKEEPKCNICLLRLTCASRQVDWCCSSSALTHQG